MHLDNRMCMITKYNVDNTSSRGFLEIILKSSMLEASTRARTEDSTEIIKLFENIFFSNEQNSQHNRYGVSLKQKQFALS